jgi:hypothetical protein
MYNNNIRIYIASSLLDWSEYECVCCLYRVIHVDPTHFHL